MDTRNQDIYFVLSQFIISLLKSGHLSNQNTLSRSQSVHIWGFHCIHQKLEPLIRATTEINTPSLIRKLCVRSQTMINQPLNLSARLKFHFVMVATIERILTFKPMPKHDICSCRASSNSSAADLATIANISSLIMHVHIRVHFGQITI